MDTSRADGGSPGLVVETTEAATGVALELVGELDLHSRSVLTDALDLALAASPARIGLDLTGVAFIDSAGLGALLSARRSAEQAGIELVVVAMSDRVARLVELAGVADLLGPA